MLQLQGELQAVEDAARKSSEADMDGQALVRRCLVSQAPRPSALPPRHPTAALLPAAPVLPALSHCARVVLRRYFMTQCCLNDTMLP